MNTRTFSSSYFRHLGIATVVAAVMVPYVWFTNATVSRRTILLDALCLWLLSPVCLWLSEKAIPKRMTDVSARGPVPVLAPILGYVVALGSAVLIFLPIHSLFEVLPFHPTQYLGRAPLVAALIPFATTYIVLLSAVQMGKRREVELRLKSERDRSAFTALAAQLRPHFLFNSLNALEALIDLDPEAAKTCTRKLAQLYRKILTSSEQRLVPLQEEVELVKDYLLIQKHRLGERLQIEWKISESLQKRLSEILMPPLMLLNLVENAIKHGLETTLSPKPLEIEVTEGDARSIQIEVRNSFELRSNPSQLSSPLFSPDPRGTHFGIQEARTRLHLLYGAGADLTLQLNNGVAVAILMFPLQRNPS